MQALEAIVALLLLALLAGMAGLTAAWALYRGFRGWTVVLAASASAAFLILFLILADSRWDAPTAWKSIEQYLTATRESEEARWPSLGLPPQNLPVFRNLYTQFIVLSFPAWLLFLAFLVGLTAAQGTAALMSRVMPRIEPPRPFRLWTFPEPLVFGFIAGCLLKLFRPESDHHVLNVLANNLLVFFIGVYTVAGLCIVSHFFHRWRFPFLVRLLGYFLLFQLASLAAAAFGIMDVWFDFRKVKGPSPGEVRS